MTKREELIREYGLKLAQQALWSPGTVRRIAEHALTHCDVPVPPDAAALEERIGDLLARQWGAIKSAEINDIPTIAQYLAENLFPDEEAGAVNKYAHLIGLTYPDVQGRTVTVLDVDEHGRALMERGGSYWGCRAEYLLEEGG